MSSRASKAKLRYQANKYNYRRLMRSNMPVSHVVNRPLHPRGGRLRDTVYTNSLVVPDMYVTKLKATNNFTTGVQLTAQTYNFHSFNINGLYDFDLATGNPPVAGFTEMQALYNRYRVISASIQVTGSNPSTTVPYYMSLFLSPLTTPPGTWAQWKDVMGNKYTRTVMIQPTGGQSTKTVKLNCNLGRLLGNSKTYYSDDDYAGIGNSNPATLMYIHVAFFTIDGSAQTVLFPFDLQARFRVQFFQRKTLTS